MKYSIFRSLLILSILAFISCSQTEVMDPTGSEPDSMKISPGNSSIEAGEVKRFSLFAYDEYGHLIDVDADWSMENNYGQINNQGLLYVPFDITGTFPKFDHIIAKCGNVQARVPIEIKLGKYWIYSENHSPTQFHYDQPNPPIAHGGKLNQYGGIGISDSLDDPEGGVSCLKVEGSAGGLFWIYNTATNPVSEDMHNYAQGYISFYIKIENLFSGDIIIAIEDIDGNKTERNLIADYGVPVDNKWNLVEIPLPHFSNVDFTKLKIPLNFYIGNPCVIYLDEIHYFVE